MAIALDGGVPDSGADDLAARPRGIFARLRGAARSPSPESREARPSGAARAAPEGPAGRGRAGRRPRRRGAHRAVRAGGIAGAPGVTGTVPASGAAPWPPPSHAAAEVPGSGARPRGGRRPSPVSGLASQRLARTESSLDAEPGEPTAGPADFDARLVKESFSCLTANAPLAMEHFYAHLFIASPETRAMFPLDMSQMRERLFAGLTRLVWCLDSPADSAAYLGQLGREHRKYGVKDKHFAAFFGALLETAAYFSGSSWTAETEASWRGALEYAARTMRTAAQADARDHPAWWIGDIVAHERRTDSVAVLTIRPDKPLPYRAGQYVPVQVPRWPRVWRPYSIANAPRPDGLISLHVRAVQGGMVSTDLVRHAAVGDTVLLGPAAGGMTAPAQDNGRALTCVAGGTGLAPLKAIVEATAARWHGGRPRPITLFVGARRMTDLYDLPDLHQMQAAYPGLQVILVLSDDSVLSREPMLSPEQASAGMRAMTGQLPGAVPGQAGIEDSEVCLCGPAAMVRRTAQLLAGRVPAGQVHHDPLPDCAASASWQAEASLSVKFRRPG